MTTTTFSRTLHCTKLKHHTQETIVDLIGKGDACLISKETYILQRKTKMFSLSVSRTLKYKHVYS